MSKNEAREQAILSSLDASVSKRRQLSNDMIAARTGKENTEREMEEIIRDIREEFAVESIDDFRKSYFQELESNEKKVAEFAELLDQCAKAKEEVEAEFE